jgi:Ca-activated chloride channel family protein
VRLDCTIFAVATLILGSLVTPLTAQFSSGVSVVEVYASVTDARGEPVTGLVRDDFEVFENGVAQPLSAFAAGDFPLSVAVALDRSFSMSGSRLAVARSAARVFLGELRPADESAIIAIGSQVETVAPLSTDREGQYQALARIDAFGTTGLYDAVSRAIALTQEGRGRRALVLLSDGNDRYSTTTGEEALDQARRSDVMVYPIALGTATPPFFERLAALTGGRVFPSSDPRLLNDTMRRVARELRLQYLLGYSPVRPGSGTPEWRAITVRVKRPGLSVRARDGYLAR